jgi:hypothetical protein
LQTSGGVLQTMVGDFMKTPSGLHELARNTWKTQ